MFFFLDSDQLEFLFLHAFLDRYREKVQNISVAHTIPIDRQTVLSKC